MSAERPIRTTLPVVTLPVAGECLGSWIGRIAAWYSIPVRVFLAHLGIVSTRGSRNWLILGHLDANEIMILAKSLRRATKTLTAMASSPLTLLANSEFGMCAYCVTDALAAGKPMYWRSAWLDCVTVGCMKHAVWLTPVDGSLFVRSRNWRGVDQDLLGIAKNEANGNSRRTTSSVPERIGISALTLQSIFEDNATDVTAQTRYGVSSSRHARLIALDLLDVLLAADIAGSKVSALSGLASFLDMPLTSAAASIGRRQARSTCIRHVKTLDARIFAMAMVDALMYASSGISERNLRSGFYDARSLRKYCLWALMPISSVDLLTQRIKNWPANYVKTCWPELENAEKIPMLRRSRHLISGCSIREKLHLPNVH